MEMWLVGGRKEREWSKNQEKWRKQSRNTSLESRRQSVWLLVRGRSCHGVRLSKSRKEKKERRGSEWRVNQNINPPQNETSQTEISPSSHRCRTNQPASQCRSLRKWAESHEAQMMIGCGENPGSIFEIATQGPNTTEVSCMSPRGQWKEVWDEQGREGQQHRASAMQERRMNVAHLRITSSRSIPNDSFGDRSKESIRSLS